MAAELPLFRPQVLDAQRAQWLGSVHLARPPSFSVVTAASLVLGIALVAFGLWGEIRRKATVPGVLLPVGGLLQVSSPQSGVIGQWLVHEGDVVQAGQDLLHIRSEHHTGLGESGALATLALAQRRSSLEAEARLIQQQADVRQDALADRLRSLAAEERQAQAEESSLKQRAKMAQQSLSRYQELAAGGFVSAVQVQQRQEELLDVEVRSSNAHRGLQALQREQASIKADMQANAAAAKTSREQMLRSLAALGQEDALQAMRQGATVKAPQAGRVSAVMQVAGQAVQGGQTLLSLVPISPDGRSSQGHGGDSPQAAGDPDGSPGAGPAMEAVLFAPSRSAGFVAPGQPVWVRYAAYPYQKFGMAAGRVHSVSDSPLSPQDLPSGLAPSILAAAQSQEPLRRITVRLEKQQIAAFGKHIVLTAGLALEADVVQESRKVWEWMFEPLLAARQHAVGFLSANPNKASPGG